MVGNFKFSTDFLILVFSSSGMVQSNTITDPFNTFLTSFKILLHTKIKWIALKSPYVWTSSEHSRLTLFLVVFLRNANISVFHLIVFDWSKTQVMSGFKNVHWKCACRLYSDTVRYHSACTYECWSRLSSAHFHFQSKMEQWKYKLTLKKWVSDRRWRLPF